MAGFKTLNSADPSVRRPLRVSDLQDLWDGLGTIFAGVPENTVKVVSGFELDDNNTVLEGVLIYNHRLYYYEGGLAMLGDTIYLYDEPSDPRVFADGQTRDFSFLNVATVAGIYDDGLVAVQLTPQFIGDRLILPSLDNLRSYGGERSLPADDTVVMFPARDSFRKYTIGRTNSGIRLSIPAPAANTTSRHDIMLSNPLLNPATVGVIIASDLGASLETSVYIDTETTSQLTVLVSATATDVFIDAYSNKISSNPL